MITRRKVRNVLSWAGIAVGIAGVVLYLFSWVATLTYEGPLRELEVGRGAIHLAWHHRERTVWRPVPGAAPLEDVPDMGRPPSIGEVRPLLHGGRVIYTEEGYIPATRVTRPRQMQFQAGGAWRWRPDYVFDPEATPAGHLIIPAWILVLLGAWCAYRRLPWDVAPNTCPKCMFDLTGTPPLKETPGQVRCPERGKVSRRSFAAV